LEDDHVSIDDFSQRYASYRNCAFSHT
jgi:hypothetical protein